MKNNPTLLLRLEAVMQSWGERAKWDVRDTGTEPTKSGIVGLLGCALGYSNSQLPELNNSLRMGVRVNSTGLIEKDFQTISGYFRTAEGGWKYFRSDCPSTGIDLDKILANPKSKPYTLVSPRYYMADASFLVGLQSKDPNIILDCAEAIKNPKWPLFLGRKSYVPTKPIFESLEYSKEPLENILINHIQEEDSVKYLMYNNIIIDDINGDIIKNDNIVGYYKNLIYGERRVRSFYCIGNKSNV